MLERIYHFLLPSKHACFLIYMFPNILTDFGSWRCSHRCMRRHRKDTDHVTSKPNIDPWIPCISMVVAGVYRIISLLKYIIGTTVMDLDAIYIIPHSGIRSYVYSLKGHLTIFIYQENKEKVKRLTVDGKKNGHGCAFLNKAAWPKIVLTVPFI